MSVLSKVVGLWMLGRTASTSAILFQRLLAGLAAIAVLAVVTAILIGVLMVGLLYLMYTYLVAHGLEPNVAMLVVGGVTLAFLALTVAYIVAYWRKVRSVPQQLVRMNAPISTRLHDVVDAFMSGMSDPVPPSRSRYN
jgi:hypothetical protein